MKIKTTVTQEREVEVEIPFFRKNPHSFSNYLFAVLDEKTSVTVYMSDGRTCIENDDIVGKTRIEDIICERYQTWSEISEAEFMTTYSEALKSLSLEPVLVSWGM